MYKKKCVNVNITVCNISTHTRSRELSVRSLRSSLFQTSTTFVITVERDFCFFLTGRRKPLRSLLVVSYSVVEAVFQTTHAFFTSRFDLSLKSFSPWTHKPRRILRIARKCVCIRAVR